ncbi:methyltransferase domain-containing protein [Prochlorococcus marinus]|uniref:methyltransferase domain-containing protein n=1 Tax=Prochlorococcus marinus TaxID=1219 RepID=UPI0022B5BCD3|nr:methyltransferase domain-containing protein [Prochlorococcus marinus]
MNFQAINSKSLDKCVVCGSDNLQSIFNLSNIFLTGYFPLKNETNLIKTPITLNLCNECNNIQMKEKVDPKNMFVNYWYRSSTTNTMKDHLQRIVHNYGIKNGRLFDIGCNDGTLIQFADNFGMEVFGIDPSNAVEEIPNKYKTKVFNDFFNLEFCKTKLLDLNNSFDLVTVISMFYDISKPLEFLTGIKYLLKDTGKAIIEVNYAKDFFQRKNVDMLGQEHLIYYFIKTFEIICRESGLFIHDAYLTEMNGGNITFVITKSNLGKTKNLLKLIEEEIEWLNKFNFKLFENNVKTEFRLFHKWIKEKSNSSKIKILGASTRGALVSQMIKLNSKIIISAVDLQLNKKGRLIPGSNISIEYDPEHDSPDCYLVMPYQFKSEIINRYENFLKDGGELIFYRPKFSIVKFDFEMNKIIEEPIFY